MFYATYYIGGIFTGLCNTSWFGWKNDAICGELPLKIINIFFSALIGGLGGNLIFSGQYSYIVWFSKRSERGKYFGLFFNISRFR